jgi:hypothetical protein
LPTFFFFHPHPLIFFFRIRTIRNPRFSHGRILT